MRDCRRLVNEGVLAGCLALLSLPMVVMGHIDHWPNRRRRRWYLHSTKFTIHVNLVRAVRTSRASAQVAWAPRQDWRQVSTVFHSRFRSTWFVRRPGHQGGDKFPKSASARQITGWVSIECLNCEKRLLLPSSLAGSGLVAEDEEP